MSISYVLRAWRWRFFFTDKAPSFFDSYKCLIIGFFMNNVLPARIGELVRAQVGGKMTKLSRAHVLGTIAGERLADGLAISLLFGFLFSLFDGGAGEERGQALYYVAYLFMAASVLTALLLFVRHKIFSLLERVNSAFSGKLSTYALERIRRFIEGLDSLRSPRRVIILFFSSLVVWCVELVVYWQVSLAFNQSLTLGELAVFLASVNFSSLIPAAPGGVGVIEALASLALVEVGINHSVAVAMVAVQHVIQIAIVGIPGALFFFLYTNRRENI